MVGSGGAQLVQAVRAAYPHLDYYCVDLPTQLYVAGQVLKANFPGKPPFVLLVRLHVYSSAN